MDDDNDLPTSPRKKLKAHHDPDKKMDSKTPLDSANRDDRLDKEVQCGIVEYLSPHLPGFTGILKKRYTDFLVNEILPNGQVIHLDNLTKPADQTQLSQAASKNPQHSTPRSDRSTQGIGQPAPIEEDLRPRFLSTNLNKIEEGSRKKEKVYMRHGPDTLILVNGEENRSLNGSKSPAAATEEKTAQHESLQPTESDQIDGHQGTLQAEGKDTEASTPTQAVSREALDIAEAPIPTQPSGTVGGWQTYAQSNTMGGGSMQSSFELSDEDRSLLTSYFDPEVVEQILSLFQRILASPQRKARDFGTVTTKPIPRDVRTDIHQALRRIFSSRLESTTAGDGTMVIAAANPSSNRGKQSNAGRNNWNTKPQQPNGKAGWAVLGGDYLHFTLYKENKDTMEVISYLAKELKLRPGLFQFAGTKDRRGITVQRVSVYRTQAKKLVDAGRTLRNARIGNYEYHPQGLQLGDLRGNEFLITLRDCQFPGNEGLDISAKTERASSIVGTAVENFTSHGFINYYGLQRFGSFSTGTHTIGRSMLKGDFKAACEAILWFNPSALTAAQQDPNQQDSDISWDDKARASALHAFATTGHSQQALDELPRKFSAESCLVRHLARSNQKNDYLGALQTISRNLRLMYVHAYQSLVWNTAATARWKAHGSKVLPGDLVLVTEHPDPSSRTDTAGPEVDQDGEPVIAAEASDRAYTSDEIFTRARALTETELGSPDNKITIFDIVLPTPGYDILYPANDSANIYKEFMASPEGGGLDPYDMRRKWKDVSLSGSYRKLLAKPLGKVEWQVRAYGMNGEDEQFVETDLEKMERDKKSEREGWQDGRGNDGRDGGDVVVSDSEGRAAVPAATAPAVASNDDDATMETNEPTTNVTGPQHNGNDKIAVILKTQLGSSTYATMALRELMKEGGVKTWKVEYGGGR